MEFRLVAAVPSRRRLFQNEMTAAINLEAENLIDLKMKPETRPHKSTSTSWRRLWRSWSSSRPRLAKMRTARRSWDSSTSTTTCPKLGT